MERERMLEELAAIPARHETAVKDYQERYGAAVAYRAHHQEMMRLAGEADMQWSHLNAHKHESAGRLRDALRQNPPHVLANAQASEFSGRSLAGRRSPPSATEPTPTGPQRFALSKPLANSMACTKRPTT
jgi:hypothetical protein